MAEPALGSIDDDEASGGTAPRAGAVLVVDEAAVCVEASLAACRLLGWARSRLVGSAITSVLQTEAADRFEASWPAMRERGGRVGELALASGGEVVAVVTAGVLPSRHLVALQAAGPVTAPSRRAPTPREREVLRLLAAGRTDGQIAIALALSPATVQTHVRNAKSKLGARTRAQAVAIAMRQGLIEIA